MLHVWQKNPAKSTGRPNDVGANHSIAPQQRKKSSDAMGFIDFINGKEITILEVNRCDQLDSS